MTAPILYGVWTPGAGWLKGRKSSTGEVVPLSFESLAVAEQTAKRIGNRSSVFYIDDTLAAIEEALIQSEAEQARKRKEGSWHGLMKRLRNLW